MAAYDLIVRASDSGGEPLALGISDGAFVTVAREIDGSASEVLDCPEQTVYPGWIDAHVHFNEPGRAHWEGIATGSKALAKGGGTCFFDMPLNSSPPVLDRRRLEEKAAVAAGKSCLDFALWGGLTPGSIDHLEDMAEGGAIGFKAFLCHSGLDEFPSADSKTLKAGMKKAADLGLPVATHAEFDPPARTSAESDMRAWLQSRPVQLELDAIGMATELAGEVGCALHVVHVSCPEGVEKIARAKAAGVDVTVETCPHYLLLDETDAVTIGAAAKCAPPPRDAGRLKGLWRDLRKGRIDTLGSDHSPSPPDLKQGDDVFAIWGGVAGIQHGLPLLLGEEAKLGDAISNAVARRFRLPQKGGIVEGNDADFILVSRAEHTIVASDLVTSHRISPYINRTAQRRIDTTFLRGKRVTPQTRGRYLKPLSP